MKPLASFHSDALPEEPDLTESPSVAAQDSRKLMLAAYSSVIPRAGAIYCSGAITSGRRAMGWLTTNGISGQQAERIPSSLSGRFAREVVWENIRALRAAAAALRKQTPHPVIDPSVLPHINGWNQEYWRDFWTSVVLNFVREIVFVDDWQFSRGACYEFLAGLKKGIPMRQYSTGDAIDFNKGRNMIFQSIREMETAQFDVDPHRELLAELDTLRETA